MFGDFKEYCFNHNIMSFFGFRGTPDAHINAYRRLAQGTDDQWTFAHSLDAGGRITHAFQRPQALTPIISFMVTDPTSVHNRVLDTFRVYNCLRRTLRDVPLLDKRFPPTALEIGLVIVSFTTHFLAVV